MHYVPAVVYKSFGRAPRKGEQSAPQWAIKPGAEQQSITKQLKMKTAAIRQKIKPMILPLAMIIGVVFHEYIHYIAFLSPYLIFVMLLITYCKVKPRDFHVGPYIWWLLAVQILGALAVYFALRPLNEELAKGAFICVFCPTATAAPVITGMLGGSVTKVATYSLFSHLCVALLTPPILSYMEPGANVVFMESLIRISKTVVPLILGPLALAFILRAIAPKVHHAIATRQSLSFYIWALALIIVVGNSISSLIKLYFEEQKKGNNILPDIFMLAGISLVVCIMLFTIGRIIGKNFGDKISGAQSLGQKNTVLAIWLAVTYISPLVSAAPAAYVAWHNTVNSYQIYLHERRQKRYAQTHHEDKE
jgi:BASS family bile acid:Na+ symporter